MTVEASKLAYEQACEEARIAIQVAQDKRTDYLNKFLKHCQEEFDVDFDTNVSKIFQKCGKSERALLKSIFGTPKES